MHRKYREPMELEEKYTVKIVFTDQYGIGTIENEVMP